MKNKDNELLYLEHYPHYMGTKNAIAMVNVELLMLMECNKEDWETLQDISDLIKAGKNQNIYAFFDILDGTSVKKILSDIKKTGFWVGVWEGGSFALCLPDFKTEAINGIARQEAEIDEEEFDFDV